VSTAQGHSRSAKGTEASFGDLLERWYERSVADWSPATALAHRSIIDRHLIPALGRRP
jgi:hypothetical protein